MCLWSVTAYKVTWSALSRPKCSKHFFLAAYQSETCYMARCLSLAGVRCGTPYWNGYCSVPGWVGEDGCRNLTKGEWSFGMQLMFVYVANLLACSGGHVEKIWLTFMSHSCILYVHLYSCIISSKHAPSLNVLVVCVHSILSSTARQSRLSSPTLPIRHWLCRLSHIYSKIVNAAN